MNTEYTKNIFLDDKLVDYYDDITFRFGLYKSEAKVLIRYLKNHYRILDLGCGTGRTTIGLYKIGFRNIVGVDISEKMIERAYSNANKLSCAIDFIVADAMYLPLGKELFDCVFFSFNGLMLIPGIMNRSKACSEINRVLKEGGYFIFTTPYLDNKLNTPFWTNRSNVNKLRKFVHRLYRYLFCLSTDYTDLICVNLRNLWTFWGSLCA
jgi:ubiquinone/menaquinone biosynthesis C-methylase UbiE